MAFLGGTPRRQAYAKILVLAVLLTAGVTAATPTSATPLGLEERAAPLVIETHGASVDVADPALIADMEAVHDQFEKGASLQVLSPDFSGPHQAAAVSSGMTVAFDAGFPAPSAAQTVVLAAASDWDDAIVTSATSPVEIAVIWKDLGSGSLLGSAGPNGLYAGPSLPTTSYYPAPLANALLGYDVNGGATPELTINLNSQANWYIGTGGTPGWGQIDLYSVVLHEIGHGLGFLGSGSLYNESPSSQVTLETPSFVFDREVTYNGVDLLSSSNPDSLLQTNNLFLDISNGLDTKLYAPGTWQEGSSFSHFDESTHGPGQPGSMMTPSLSTQETARQLDSATLGIMARIGWPMRVGATTPTITSTSANSGQLSVSWTLDLGRTAVAPDSLRVEAWLGATPGPSIAVAAGVTSATISGLQNGNIYTVKVVPVAFGQDGVPTAAFVSLPAVPTTPRAISATGSGLSRTVSWLPAEGVSADSYEVQRSSDGGSWVALGSTSGLSVATTVSEGVHQFRVRGHNSNGIGSWGYSIPLGISDGIVRPVPLDGQISRLYQAYFLRSPDSSGFYFWRDQRAAGLGLHSLSDAFAGSAEFAGTYGSLSNDQFIDLVYQNVLGRAPDSAGRAHWLNVLASGASRGEVMVGFSDSGEFVSNTETTAIQTTAEAEVYRLYVAFFLRVPDATGHDYWVGARAGGASLETIAAAFATSTEFQAVYGALDDAHFVSLVYNNVLARNPDTAGSSYWQGLLSVGTDRGAMMTGFSESLEFVLATGTLP